MKYPLFKVFMSENVNEYLDPVLRSGMITQGPRVELFEQKLKEYLGYPHLLTLNSATSGLTLALRLLNLNPDDEVISTALTCTATNWPLLDAGVKIVWADVDKDTCGICISSIKEKITPKTRAVMVVHWGGYPVDLDELEDVIIEAQNKYGIKITIIQDCAHSFGSKYKGRFLGTTDSVLNKNLCESIAIYSFQAIKHLTTGDGGLILLPPQMYERAKLLRWFGISREKRDVSGRGGDFRMEEDIPEWGYKFHMNDISASIGLANIVHVTNNINKHQLNSKYYASQFKNLKNVTLLNESNYCESSCWLFTMKVSDKKSFIEYMTSKQIMVSQVHKRNDNHSCIVRFKTSLPNLDELEKEIICIPNGWWLSQEDIEFIANCVKDWDTKQETFLRECLSTDYENFLKLLSQLNGYDYLSKCSGEEFEKKLRLMKNQNSTIFVKEENGKLIATCKAFVEEKFGDCVVHIEDVCVDFQHRGKGIGKKLIKCVIDKVKEHNPYKIILNCSPSLKTFYENSGFKIKGIEMIIS